MNYQKSHFIPKIGLISTILGGLALAITAIPLAARAQYQTDPNTQERMQDGNAVIPSQPPLPATQSTPVAYLPAQQQVNIRLVNNTGDPITFEVIGDTNQRQLSGESMTMLDSLDAPLTLTFQRPNGGLINVNTYRTEGNTLEVSLESTTSLSVDANTLRIDDDGRVYAY
jgi:hypothetical protein